MKTIKKKIILLSIAFVLIIGGFILETLKEEELVVAIFYGFSFIIGGYYTLKEAISHLKKEKTFSVDFLMIIAAIGAFIIREYKEGAILIIIFGLSHILEDYAILKSEKTFKSLLKIAPDEATLVLDNNTEKVVNVNELIIGDIIKVKVGDQISADGTIIEGSTAINEKTITGEFLPSEKTIND